MRITVEHTIWCERCCLWVQESVRNKGQFIKLMRKAGWAIRAGATCCPECVQDLKEGRKWHDISYRKAR